MRNYKVISITNQKGGVGKTTSVLNLAVALHAIGKKVLMVDNDHQGNLTAAVGLTPAEQKYTLTNLLLAAIDYSENITIHIQRTLLPIKDGLDLIPANRRLADAAARLQVMQLSQYNAVGNSARYCEKVMSELLLSVPNEYDYIIIYIIIDCGLQHELFIINPGLNSVNA